MNNMAQPYEHRSAMESHFAQADGLMIPATSGELMTR
jgi:hypothetical protein